MQSIIPVSLFLAQVDSASRINIFELFIRSGPMAWFVASVLIGLSLASWAVMIARYLQFQRASSQTGSFLAVFRKSQRFSEVASQADRLQASPLVSLFRSGYIEIDAQVKAYNQDHPEDQKAYKIKSLTGLERSLNRAANVEVALLSRGTGLLATTAAASPFIGLFGTVWGIMVAFQDIGASGSTSLVAVAPGIAEALVNTALGLGAAIPALMGYNYFAHRIRDFRTQMTDFTLEFLNLAERNFL
jgi:biopolymer transport protein TolQ